MLQKKHFLTLCILLFLCNFRFYTQLSAQQKMTVESYIETYRDIAIEHMHTYGIPASIKLSQGILESAFGNSELAVNANNHFGIKCHNWQGATYYKDDDEENECFRKYDDPLSSFKDHSLFLTSRSRYAGLFQLDITDYKGWAKGLRKAGYATNPRYPELLINIIERYNLYIYDKADLKPLVAEQADIPEKADKHEPRTVKKLPEAKRTVKLRNEIRYILAQAGDTPESIAKKFDMRPWQIYRYNEFEEHIRLTEGQIVYLQPKRRRSLEHSEHVAKRDETIMDISQHYGIKSRHLFRLNPDIHPDGLLNPGQVIILRRHFLGR